MKNGQKKILVLSSWLPYPADNGYKIRVYNSIKHLSKYYEVHLVSFMHAENERPYVDVLKEFCREVAVSPYIAYKPRSLSSLIGFMSIRPRSSIATYSREFQRLVSDQISRNRFDLVIAEELNVARYVETYSGPKMLSQHNIESDFGKGKYLAADSILARSRHFLSWQKSRHYEGRLCRHFDLCTVVSDEDKTELSGLCKETTIVTMPNGVDLSFYDFEHNGSHPTTLIYNGALTYSANEDAVQFLYQEILPLVKTAIPGVRVVVTGAYAAEKHAWLTRDPAMELTGYVPDIRPVLAKAAICVVPLRVGAGTRLKILEAMALGIPVVATSIGAKGLKVQPHQNIMIADSPGEFAAQTIELLTNPILREQIGDGGRQLVEREYDWNIIGQRLKKTIDSLVGD